MRQNPGSLGPTDADLVGRVARLVGDVLDADAPVDVDATLSALGLGSLPAARLWLEAQEQFGVDFPFSWLTGELTLRQFAGKLADSQTTWSGPVAAPEMSAAPQTGHDEPFPLTAMQQAYVMSTLPELSDDSVGCHQYQEFTLDGIDPDRLEAGWRRLIAEHDMLRSEVSPDGVQSIALDAPLWTMPVHDLRGLALNAAMREVEATRARLCDWRRDPRQWPPFAVEVSLLPGGAGVVHVDLDSIVTDGHGIALLLAQWATVYEESTAALPESRFSARDGVLAMTTDVDDGRRARDLDYWVGLLRDAPDGPAWVGPAAASHREDVDGDGGRADRASLTDQLAPAEWVTVRARAAELGVSASSLVLAAFADVLAAPGRAAAAAGAFSLVLTTTARAFLPRAAEHVVGPFTSSSIVVFDPDPTVGVADLAVAVHRQVWAGLEHSSVSGVDALRELRRRGGGPTDLPVVFTSLLGLGPEGGFGAGFNARISHAVCRTSGIALDCQVWEEAGALRWRWDYLPGRFAAGAVVNAMGRFGANLRAVAVTADADRRRATALQQSYLVARATTDDGGDGCQIYKTVRFEQDLDLDRLNAAVCGLIADHEAARSWIDPDGWVRTGSVAPTSWWVPVIELDGVANPDSTLAELRAEMVGRPFPVGRWPHFDLRVSRRGGRAVLHCACDIAVFDAPTVHLLLRDLMRRYAGVGALPDPGPVGSGRSGPLWDTETAREHWRGRARSIPGGVLLPKGATGSGLGSGQPRVRLGDEVAGWRDFTVAAAARQLTPDALLVAVFTQVLAAELGTTDFAVPVVRWIDGGRASGAATALSWVAAADVDLTAAQAAAAADAVMAEDAHADRASGLDALRARVMRGEAGADGFSVVYSSVVDLSSWPVPPGVSDGPWASCTPGVALDCVATADGDRLAIGWDADPAAFPPGWLGAAFVRFVRSVRRLLADPDAVAVVAVDPAPLSVDDYRMVVYGWNDTARDFPTDRLIHESFQRRAAHRPDAVAVRTATTRISFGDLNAQANRIAHGLAAAGVGVGSVVGVRVRRGSEMIAAVLGVMKAGATYLPVEPSLPADRVATMLASGGATLVLSTMDTPGLALPDGVVVRHIDDDIAAPGDPGDPESVARSDATAYVIFTSGSTGAPKGVAVTHRAVSNLLAWCRRTYPLHPGDVGLAVTSLGFDLSVYDIFGVLGSGASLYLADEHEQRDPAALLEVLGSAGITFWNSAPTTLAQVAALLPVGDASTGGVAPFARGGLRLVFLSGDYTPLPLPDVLRGASPGVRLVSLGGATEATVWSNYFEVGSVDPSWRSIPYGVPIDNCRYYVLDGQLRPCPPGTEGDLYIAGECLAQGYVHAPEVTAERFVTDPYGARNDDRMYRTGDRAAYAPDGTITFLGRLDGQVKIRGFRVELGEVEHRLRLHPEVRDVVVLARGDGGDRRLVAYVISVAGANPTARELREYAARSLPDYMVPNLIAFLSGFPATANGKLDRDALPWPLPASGTEVTAQPVATPVGVDEAGLRDEIATHFADLLEVETFDPYGDIWDQGATSFTLVQISSAMHRAHGHRIPISVMLADPTVAGIARHLGAALGATVTPAGPPSAGSTPAGPESTATPDGATPDNAPPAAIEFFSPEERAQFKAAHHNVRPTAASADSVRLPGTVRFDEHYRARATRRGFAAGPVPLSTVDKLLALLGESTVDGVARRLYPSAGDTYAVQTYVHVKPDGVTGLPAGVYYYRAEHHVLERVGDADRLDRGVHFYYNRPIYDHAGFELYLIGQTRGITPLYRDDAERYLAIEAGHMAQLLMQAQPETGVSLCPIGALSFDRLRPAIAGDDGHRFLLGFIAGAATSVDSATLDAASGDSAPVVAVPSVEVAIVGLSGRFPGADDPDQLWRLLRSGTSALGRPPATRPGIGGRADLVGGYLDTVDEFDSLLFHIAPAEAATLDPQLRLLLTSVWQCLEHAGHTASSLRRRGDRIGVFVAAMWHDYELVGADAAVATGVAQAGSTASDIANRISHYFGFRGPSLAVDTSCSSALTAVHLAAQSIRHGECDAAVVCAVNLLLHPHHADLLHSWGLVADNPVGGAFDPDSTGWSPGEGYGCVLLRPWHAARADGDTPYAMVAGTWVAHSGHSGRFGVPAVAELTSAMRHAIEQAGARPADVGYVECAAAGASVADTAELEALVELFGEQQVHPVPISTVKANLGHLEAAAGLSQLVKVLLQMRHDQLAPTPVRSGVTLASWASTSVRVVTDPQPWTGSRLALINAVGAGGSSAHVLVRPVATPVSAVAAPDHPAATVCPLSAATASALRELAATLRDRLTEDPPTLVDLAFTLQTGRVALAHRLVVCSPDLGGVVQALTAYVDARPDDRVRSAVIGGRADDGTAAHSTDPVRVATAWLDGREVDWAALWPVPARRVALPTYPFERQRHWVAGGVASPGPSPAASTSAEGAILHTLIARYAQVSGIAVDRINPDQPLEELGLTSALVVSLVAALANDRDGALVGCAEPTVEMLFAHRTLAGVAGWLAGARRETWSTDAAETAGLTDVAIIGIAGRYPGAADLDAFWQLLAHGRDAIGDLPSSRARPDWPTHLMKGAFLDGVDEFDPLLFGIAGRDADLMDPQERLFLEVVWQTLDDAGYPRTRLRAAHNSRVGVFAATMYSEYPFFGVEQSTRGRLVSTDSSVAGIANRVSHALDLRGPSMTVDTMCSGSLTALHLAVASLRAGECALALAGGVNLSLHPNKFIEQARMRMTSHDHRCRAFGDGGDGFAPGEGVGAVLLKPLAAALADGDRVHAVIKGTAVNHGGRTNGYTVPDPAAQAEVIADALARAGVDPATVGYVEAHGTGTRLGDPVEIAGLERVFAGLPPASCAIGSVKSNIGHLEGAAGIAGVSKVVLQLRHRTLVPTLHVDRPNPAIDWDRTPFRLQRDLTPWPRRSATPLRACVSSFGAGGSNAHVVVQEAPPAPARTAVPPGPYVVVLSARDERGLRQAARRLADTIEARGDSLPLADVAYTLQVGREPLPHRLAVVVTGRDEVIDALRRYVGGDEGPVVVGRAARRATGDGVGDGVGDPHPDDLRALATRWVSGAEVDWSSRHRRGSVRLVGLPSYPFARNAHWVPEAPATLDGPALLRKTWGRTETPVVTPVRGTVWCLHGAGQDAMTLALAHTFGTGVALVRMDVSHEPAFATEDDAARFVRDALATTPDLAGVVDLTDLTDAGDQSWPARLAVIRELAAARRAVRLLHLVSGVYDPPEPTGSGEPEPTLVGASLAGFVWAAAAESRTLTATVVDLDLGDPHRAAGAVRAEWSSVDGEALVCWRAGHRFAPDLTPARLPGTTPRLDPDRCYVVSGGTGGIGAAVATHLAERGARAIALLGYRDLPPRERWHTAQLDGHQRGVVAQVRLLEQRGVRVNVHCGPLESAPLAAFLSRVRAELGPVGGIVHCAGRMAKVGSLSHKDRESVAAVLTPKIDGIRTLTRLCQDDQPAFVVSFSSLAAVSPRLAVGVADYAAANAYLDRHASTSARTGASGMCSINWPSWGEVGMSGGGDGPGTISVDEGLRVLDAVLAGGAPANLVVLPGGDITALLSNPVRTEPRPSEPPPAFAAPVAAVVPNWLTEVFAATVGVSRDDLDAHAPFGDLGIDSVLIADLVVALEARLGRPIAPSTLLDHPTLSELAAHLGANDPDRPAPAHRVKVVPNVAGLGAERSASLDVSDNVSAAVNRGRIAIVGMSCRFPGAADTDAFWDLLRQGRHAVTDVPPSRWDAGALYRPEHAPGYSMSRWGGYLDGIELFDPDWFGLTDEEATTLDPGIRLVLEGVATCLADAGWAADEVAGRDVGVFVGARLSDYRHRVGVRGGTAAFGADQNFLAARVAQQWDLTGPNLVVDSACSSALVAVQLALRSIVAGESVAALVAGVDVLLDEQVHLAFSAARALSPTGVCRTFDATADGFVPGEGCGVLLLKSLDRALADGDRIRAVIDAVAVGNDGRTVGLTTPNPRAQAAVIRRALRDAGINAGDVGMVEAHGTGTMIGDPIELQALTSVFRETADEVGYCAIGSVKSNMGHLLSAAGIAGLAKAVLAVEHGLVPPTLFCDTPNPRFDFGSSPFYPAIAARAWPAESSRRVAGVSAFGLGGTNAHAIVRGAPTSSRPVRAPLPAPRFARRRLWLDRPDQSVESVMPPADQETGEVLVASLLSIGFDDPVSVGS